METILIILLVVTAALAAWNIRLSAQARRERGGLRQSLENLEVRMGEISGTLTGSSQSIVEAKAVQGERERSEVQHRKDILANQEKAVVSGREIQEAVNRLGEAIAAAQVSQREIAQTAASEASKNLQNASADWTKGLKTAAEEWAKKLEGIETHREESVRTGAAGLEKLGEGLALLAGKLAEKENSVSTGLEKIRESLSSEIKSVQGAWSQTADSLRAGISENREGLAESMAQGRESMSKAVEEAMADQAVRIGALLEGVRTGSVDSRAQNMVEVEAVLNRFEKRVADYLEENALKVQEILLDALDRFPEEATATQILARSDEGREAHGG